MTKESQDREEIHWALGNLVPILGRDVKATEEFFFPNKKSVIRDYIIIVTSLELDWFTFDENTVFDNAQFWFFVDVDIMEIRINIRNSIRVAFFDPEHKETKNAIIKMGNKLTSRLKMASFIKNRLVHEGSFREYLPKKLVVDSKNIVLKVGLGGGIFSPILLKELEKTREGLKMEIEIENIGVIVENIDRYKTKGAANA